MRFISKAWLLLPFLSCGISTFGQSPSGYQISLHIQPFRNQWVYLASYYGSIKTLADSAYLNGESKGAFKGSKPLPQGVYILASPSKTILGELLVGPQQHFSIAADTSKPQENLLITGSPDNDDFTAYTQFIAPRAQKAETLRKQMETADAAQKASIQQQLSTLSEEIVGFRNQLMIGKPASLLAALFQTMKEVQYPAHLLRPASREDSIAQYQFGKEHYWDGVDFMDGRLVRTPIFDNKLSAYLENWVSPEPDSVIYEYNWMIALGRNDEEMEKYLVGYFIDHYMYPKIMGQDKVFLHVFDQYISGELPKANWLNEKQLKAIKDRAYMIMANQLNAKAADMQLVDTAGKLKPLYAVEAPYTIVNFWDVHCGKCKEELPKMDTLYRTQWKAKGVKIYAVMVNEGALADWKPFIKTNAAGWIHVHQTAALRAAEEKEGLPNFRQLYDMRSTPTLYLLDKEKRIIAKNISLHDLDRLLQQKFKQP